MANLSPASLAVSLVEFASYILELLLSLRFVLKLFSANPATPFVLWVHNTSEPFLDPFQNIFPSVALDHNYIIEFSTVFAVIIYAVAAYLLSSLILALDHNIQSMLTKSRLTTAQKQYQKGNPPKFT